MHFCPKCGIVLVQKVKRFSCLKCGYVSQEKVSIVSSEKIAKDVKIGVVHDKETSVWPVVNESCPKCGNGKAYYFIAQTRAGDEGETCFFKCVKCSHTWREYS